MSLPYSLGVSGDREVARALADLRRATHGARPEALERRALVGGDRVDVQLVADQLVVVLGVGDGRLEQLAPVRARPRAGVCARIARASVDGLAADVVAHQARLAGGGAHVLGLRADDAARSAGRLRSRGFGGAASAPRRARRSAFSSACGARRRRASPRRRPRAPRPSASASSASRRRSPRRPRRPRFGGGLAAGLRLGGRLGFGLVLGGAAPSGSVFFGSAIGYVATFPVPAWPR